MTSRAQMFRVFNCPRCGYTGYRKVRSEDEGSSCNLCAQTIEHSPEWEYVDSVEDAVSAMQQMVWKKPKTPKPKSRHGIGVKKRVLYMVSDLSDLNRGKGVNRKRVLQECKAANIDVEKAKRFLSQLEEEGLIINIDGQLSVVEREAW